MFAVRKEKAGGEGEGEERRGRRRGEKEGVGGVLTIGSLMNIHLHRHLPSVFSRAHETT